MTQWLAFLRVSHTCTGRHSPCSRPGPSLQAPSCRKRAEQAAGRELGRTASPREGFFCPTAAFLFRGWGLWGLGADLCSSPAWC